MMRIGTAGWAIPKDSRSHFAGEGSHLERYGAQLNCVEINSSFYRPHKPATYARWAASVPPNFAFALKVPKEITHSRRLLDCEEQLTRFLDESSALGAKRSVLLIQIPPSFAYDPLRANHFFEMLRFQYQGNAVCEPRHVSWFTPDANAALITHRIGRVAADPALCEEAAVPGGWDRIVYSRQHGSPRTYYSRYEQSAISALAAQLKASTAAERWCIFDNTSAGAAAENALELTRA